MEGLRAILDILQPFACPRAAVFLTCLHRPASFSCAPSCRLIVFASVGDATRCWIKGRKFSLAGLLADTTAAAVVAPSPDSISGKAARASKASNGAATPAPDSSVAAPAGDEGNATSSAAAHDKEGSAADGKGSSSSLGGSSGEATEPAAAAAGAGVLSATAGLAEQFSGGSMAIFRLAPQDYHRCAGRV